LTRSPITTIILGCILSFIVFHGMNRYSDYCFLTTKSKQIERQRRMLIQQKHELDSKKMILKRAHSVLELAQNKGLVKDQWETFGVHIQERLSSDQLTNILNQCANSKSYYFKPIALHMKNMKHLNEKNQKTQKTEMQSKSVSNSPLSIIVNINGAFIAKNQSFTQ